MPTDEKAGRESRKDQTLAMRLHEQKRGTLNKQTNKKKDIYSNMTTICMYKCLFTQGEGRHEDGEINSIEHPTQSGKASHCSCLLRLLCL